jgi:hypothetical protein
LMNCISKNEKKTHGQQNHPLEWVCHPPGAVDGASNCNLCGLRYKTGMFCCRLCQNKYCALCYHDPNRPKPQVGQRGNQGDLLANLMAMQMLGGLMRN